MAFDAFEFDLTINLLGRSIPLVGFQCTYGLNGIPSAVATLPVGIRHDTLLPSPSHEVVSGSGLYRVPATVRLAATRRPGVTYASAMAPMDGLIFDGFATGPGLRRTADSYGLTLGLTHWLDTLNGSSVLSATSHPANPADFTFNAVLDNKGAGKLAATYRTAAQRTLKAGAVREDLWGKAIRPWFDELAAEDRLSLSELSIKRNDGDGAVRRALASITAPLPLAMTDAEGFDATVARQVADEIADVTLNPQNSIPGLANTTFWNKIVGELGPTFLFALVPRVSDAFVVPFIPGLRSAWTPRRTATFLSDDIDFLDLGGQTIRPLRAVVLFNDTIESASGGYKPDPAGTEPKAVAAFQGLEGGLVLMRRVPRFLSRMPGSDTDFAASMLVDPATASRPTRRGKDTAAERKAQETRDAQAEAKRKLPSMRAKLAQALYAYEALKGRGGQLAGPPRFDVAPGSTVMIDGLGSGTPAYFATVVAVTHEFDAQRGLAGTMFQLAHARSLRENQLDQTSVASHPLYKTSWSGWNLTGPPPRS